MMISTVAASCNSPSQWNSKVRSLLRVSTGLGLLLSVAAASHAEDTVGVRTVAFSPSGKMLAAGTGEPAQPGTVTLWDVATRRQLWKHGESSGVPAVAFSSDGQTIAIAVHDNAARLLDVAGGKVLATLKHPKPVRAIAFSPDGMCLATACLDKLVRVWDLATGTEKLTCTGHRDRICAVDFSPHGRHMLSVGGDDGAKLWDAATGAEARTFKHYFMPCGRFSPDGKWVITGSYDGTTRVWNVGTGEVRARFSGTGGVHQLAFSSAAHTLAVCSGRDISFFDLNLSEPTPKDTERLRVLLAKLDNDSYEAREATSKELLDIGFAAEADLRRAATESKSVEVRVRARRLRQEMLSKPRATLRGHTDAVAGVALSPDGKLLASGSSDGTLRLWDVASTKEAARLVPGK